MTLRHVVVWKLATADEQERREQTEQMRTALLGLADTVPAIEAISAGADVVGTGNWDFGLVVDVADETALAAYQAHPEHQKVGAFIRSVVADRACADFLV